MIYYILHNTCIEVEIGIELNRDGKEIRLRSIRSNHRNLLICSKTSDNYITHVGPPTFVLNPKINLTIKANLFQFDEKNFEIILFYSYNFFFLIDNENQFFGHLNTFQKKKKKILNFLQFQCHEIYRFMISRNLECKKNKKRRKPERNSFRSWELIIQRP